MSDPIATYVAAFEASRDRLQALAGLLSDDPFNWKPDEKAWSVGECIAHLNVMARGYVPSLTALLTREDLPRAEPPFTYGLVSRLFVNSVRPGSRPIPTGPAMKPPPAVGRRSTIDRQEAMADLERYTDDYVALTEASRGLDLRRVRMRSPFLPVWISLGAYLDGLGQHALRHTLQAERVAACPDFPG